jgi:pimeloyl-ACP methyl ester carboxylesterase
MTSASGDGWVEERIVRLPHGIELGCREAGPPQAPLVVFLHGFPEAAFVWDPVIERLSERFRCVAPNLRGYAGSSAPSEVEAYRARHLVADVASLVGVLRPDAPRAAAVVAHDWGGAVAWNLAALRPDVLARLVIVNAPPPATFLKALQTDPAQQAASAYMNDLVRPDAEQRLAADDFAALFEVFTRMGPAGAGWLTPAMRARYRAVWQQGLTGPLNWYRASPLRPPTADDASVLSLQLPEAVTRVTVPTKVIWGLADKALPPTLLDGLDVHVPDLQVVRLEGATHWVIHEYPARVAAEVAAFLDV